MSETKSRDLLRSAFDVAVQEGNSPLAVSDGAHFCLECRTLLRARRVCDGGKRHRVVNLDDPSGRAALYDEVWGPMSARRRAKEMAKAGGTGVALDSCAGGLGDCGDCGLSGDMGEFAVVVLGLIAVFIVFVALYWIGSKLLEWHRKRSARLKARGALVAAPRGVGATRNGMIVSGPSLGIADDGRAIVGLSAEFAEARWSANAITLRYAETGGFLVRLDSGELLMIPEGALRLHGGHREAMTTEQARERLNQWLPCNQQADEFDFALIPWNTATLSSLRVGDRVAVAGHVVISQAAPSVVIESGFRVSSGALTTEDVPVVTVIAQ
ncbi:MAG: hypothetical protein Q8Q09_11355 [Deltaproteobacteria bacterium]|nr:hypothetical protein [Deltaproteobacteria bacterium]